MATEITIGIVGMGWMGQVHSRSYRQIADRFADSGIQPVLVACADDVEERAREGQSRFGFERSTTDWRDVIDDPKIAAISITASNNVHLEIATAAAAAGKHIYCEKPVGRSPAETAEIESCARAAGILSFVGYNYRWPPMVQHARNLIASGRLGELTHYRGRFLVGYANHPDGALSWRFQRELAGLGTLGDLMSHVIDMAHFLYGPIVRVVGNQHTFIKDRPVVAPGSGTHFAVAKGGKREAVTNEDYVGALAQFANGVQGTFEACRVISGKPCQMAFEVHGARGALAWDYERLNELDLYLPDEPGDDHDGHTRLMAGPQHPLFESFQPGAGNSMGYDDLKTIEAYHFLKSIRDGEQGTPGFADALAVARVQAAIIRSCEQGAWEAVTDSV
jgi:predicted dehydrogenase